MYIEIIFLYYNKTDYKMTDRIIIPIDTIGGDDSTGSQIINGQPVSAYKNLEYAYNTQRQLYPDSPFLFDIIRGNPILNFNISNSQISGTNGISNLIIMGLQQKALIFTNVVLDIDTDIKVPTIEDKSDLILPEVIRTINYFEITVDSDLNISESDELFNGVLPSRDIFFHEGIAFVENKGGIVDLRRRNSRVHVGGTIIIIGFFDQMYITSKSGIYRNDESIQTIIVQAGSDDSIQISNINIYDYSLDSIISTKINIGVFIDAGLRLFGVSTIVISLILFIPSGGLSLLLLPIGIGSTIAGSMGITEIILSNVKPYEERKKNSLTMLSNLKVKYDDPKVHKIVNHHYSKISDSTEFMPVEIHGGSVVNKTPDILKLSLINYPADINRTNLVDTEPFTYNKFLKIDPENYSDYNITQDTNSYNNSGSIFHLVKIIKNDYVHTKDDGYIFLIDAGVKSIKIVIPEDVLENRTFQYKRIDNSQNRVIIKTKNGIDNCNKYCLINSGKKLAKVKLVGYNKKLWTV